MFLVTVVETKIKTWDKKFETVEEIMSFLATLSATAINELDQRLRLKITQKYQSLKRNTKIMFPTFMSEYECSLNLIENLIQKQRITHSNHY